MTNIHKQFTLSVVIPVYNEETAFLDHFKVILQQLDLLENVTVDVVVVNDGSSDRTEDIVNSFVRIRDDIQLLSFTRNFGKEAAILAGLNHAKGDAVVVMDSDLQHPPQLIGKMLESWRQGAYIVEAYKVSRGRESFFSWLLAKSFYRIFDHLSGMDLRNQCDFKLLDRLVVNAYTSMPERGRFFRGVVQWLGFPAIRLPFEVPERPRGGSAWSRLRLFSYSISAITSFSAVPLQFVTIFGFMTLGLSLFFGVLALYYKFTGAAVSGFTTVILLILIIGSILMMSLGLMGIYIARIYEEIKGRPGYVVKPKLRSWENEESR